jgi:hypothetical protein
MIGLMRRWRLCLLNPRIPSFIILMHEISKRKMISRRSLEWNRVADFHHQALPELKVNFSSHPTLIDRSNEAEPSTQQETITGLPMVDRSEILKMALRELVALLPNIAIILMPVGKYGFWREWQQNGSRKEKRGYGLDRNPLKYLVGTRGFEPRTPTASR